MYIMAFGIDFSTGRRLIQPIDEQKFSDLILASFPHETLDPTTRLSVRGLSYRTEIERRRFPDLSNPHVVGWTFLVDENDPLKGEIINAMEPLAKHRGMSDPREPLLYNCDAEWKWWDWIRNNYWSLSVDQVPYYVLIVGGPEQVPFRFQSLLDNTAAVGRIHFDSISDLKEYVKKIMRIEKAPTPVVDREVIMFAPDWGITDPTYFSKAFMIQPLSKHVKDKLHFTTRDLVEDNATKENLVDAMEDANPSLVYTASHGLAAPREKLAVQRKYNGAICCQGMQEGTKPGPEHIYSADDVPSDEGYLEGSVFFEFSCFGYGTPGRSDYMHWLGSPDLNADEDFVSALPKKLLAHPRGPIGFFGHVDAAWLHGFADPADPYILDRWHSRIRPFKKAVEEILNAQTLGLVLNTMNERLGIGNHMLANAADRIASGAEVMTPEKNSTLVEYWITRTDAQNYMLFGDPATYVRIPTQNP